MHFVREQLLIPDPEFSFITGFAADICLLLPTCLPPASLPVYLEPGARVLGQKFTHLAHLFLKRAETDSASARSYQMVIFTVINFH